MQNPPRQLGKANNFSTSWIQENPDGRLSECRGWIGNNGEVDHITCKSIKEAFTDYRAKVVETDNKTYLVGKTPIYVYSMPKKMNYN